ncbi:MAG: low specificity L-threonine aldolase [Gammaproteobacteria bacterium]|nr:low specificity L-threonine aldolase [Gammaproteobacteria bacterium]
MTQPGYQFASDNTAGVAPEAWAALERANQGFAPGYGEDEWTALACELIRRIFETDCDVFFAFNGTAANSLALASMCQSYHSIICHEHAHVETDECGAPEFFSNGTKVLLARGAGGKIDPADTERLVTRRTDLHYPKPRVVSVTQPTEMGTVYSIQELEAIHGLARRHHLKLHMDGARFANALVSLDVPAADITWRRGVDVLCLGATKLGTAVGDAVVFFDRTLAEEFEYRCKQAGQLASKMRYLSAPWVGLLENGAWLKHARHANECAQRLATALLEIDGIELVAPVQANAVFVRMPEPALDHLKGRGWHFYTFIGDGGARLMCSWQTTDEDVSLLVRDIKAGVSLAN